MKVIKNNYKNTKNVQKDIFPLLIECENCESEFEIEKEDIYVGALGSYHIECPCCGHEIMLDKPDPLIITKDNLKFPTHFFHTEKSLRNVKEVLPNEIIKEIKRGIEWFRENKDEDNWYTSYGDAFVNVYRYAGDEDYYVLVSKDFYETYIPFEREDY